MAAEWVDDAGGWKMNRKLLIVGALAMLVFPPGSAHAAPYVVRGNVLLPTAAQTACGGYCSRCAYATDPTADPKASQGVIGYYFDGVHADTPFTLKADVDPAVNDFDISFYDAAGPDPCEQMTPAHLTGSFGREGDESGFVPIRSKSALVRMNLGDPNAGFTYKDKL